MRLLLLRVPYGIRLLKLCAGLAQELADDALRYINHVRALLHALGAAPLLSVEMVLARLASNKRPVAGHFDALAV